MTHTVTHNINRNTFAHILDIFLFSAQARMMFWKDQWVSRWLILLTCGRLRWANIANMANKPNMGTYWNPIDNNSPWKFIFEEKYLPFLWNRGCRKDSPGAIIFVVLMNPEWINCLIQRKWILRACSVTENILNELAGTINRRCHCTA